jgi:hypothetical protein
LIRNSFALGESRALFVCSGNADANKVAKNAEKVAQSQFVYKACILSLRMSETASKQTNPTKTQ